MKIKSKSHPFIMMGLLLMLVSSCKKDDETEITPMSDIQYNLQQLVSTSLATYKEKYPDYPGGLAMEVISKQGTFFVSAGMGTKTMKPVKKSSNYSVFWGLL